MPFILELKKQVEEGAGRLHHAANSGVLEPKVPTVELCGDSTESIKEIVNNCPVSQDSRIEAPHIFSPS